MTKMMLDDWDNPIPALTLKDGGAHAILATAASARNSNPIPTETQIVSVYATVPIFLKFGSSGVTATTNDHYFPDGVYYDFVIAGNTHIAVLRAGTSDGTVYVSEKK